ncbi:hypothetical protein LWI29_015749 [Acer saccharum]|uniref:RNase H type-1 domain-containing protein n=1 Tax=Acer saccharum TaxID=4024 RepID=A0AA39SEF9_ACESA|nr:hypothetical protein LWI29_015749 [Acer saccharum]
MLGKKKKHLVSNSTTIPEIWAFNKKVITESLAAKGHGLKIMSSKFKMPLILEEEFFKTIDMGKALGFDYKDKELNHKEVISHQPSWKSPKRGEFKINCDASFQLRSGKAGVGVIIRDYKGSAIAVSSPVLCCSSVEMLEAQACLEGIQLAIDIGVSGVIIESDAASVIQLLSDQTVPRTELGAIIHTSLALGASVNLLSYVAVRREANSVAHGIAQHALSLDSPVVWIEEMPLDIARLVRGDSPTSVCSF